jgi:hypothetical protein
MTVLGGVMMALSALARGTRSAVIALFAVIYIPELLVQILSKFRDIGWISVRSNVIQLEAVLFGVENPYGYAIWTGVFVIAAVVLLCAGAMWLRVKPTEVVK